MFIHKMETKIYNSNKIVKAIQKNKLKFDILKSISEEILKARENKKKQEKFIEKVYNIVLRNLAHKKTAVKINGNDEYYINQTGITKQKSNYSTNTESITRSNFLNELAFIKKDIESFLKVISPKKRSKFKKFMEKGHLLESKEPCELKLGKEIQWVGMNKKYIDVLKIKYQYNSDLTINYNNSHWDTFNIMQLNFEAYTIIEQIYNQVKKVLEMELKQNQKELDNIKKFLNDVDQKFSNYIKSVETLNVLKKGA